MIASLLIVGFPKKPLHNLNWDPADYQWKQASFGRNGKHLEFFQYSVKLGRNLLLESKYKCLAAMKHWFENNVQELQLAKFRNGCGACSC